MPYIAKEINRKEKSNSAKTFLNLLLGLFIHYLTTFCSYKICLRIKVADMKLWVTPYQ